MTSKHLIGIDVGTSGAKTVLIDASKGIVSTALVEYPLSLPEKGWAEQSPDDWVNATIAGIRTVLAQAGIDAGSIAGLSFSGQMHGLVCLDNSGNVLRPAILWCDTRTTAECRQIEEQMGGPSEVLRETFNSALEGFTLPKLLWVRNHEPEIYARISTILLPKDYVRFRLTGKLGMDYSDAAGTMLLNVGKLQWSDVVTDALEINRRMLPPLGHSAQVAGNILPEIASATGLPPGLPVAYGGADNACAAVGTGVVSEGTVAVSIGTSGTVIAPVAKPVYDEQGRVHTFNHSVPAMWYVMGVMQAAGLSLKWFKDTFGAESGAQAQDAENSYTRLTAGADKIAPGADGLLWLPYLNGERTPHLDPLARGVLFGITARHTKAHVMRAVMEGVAFGLKDSLEIIQSMGIAIDKPCVTGGGGKSPVWRQILADVFQKPVHTLNVEEGPAFGAAIIAGVATGVFPDFASASKTLIKFTSITEPNRALATTYAENHIRYGRLYEAIKPEF